MKKNYRLNIYQKIALEMMTITINLLFMCKNIISLKNINGNSTKSLFIFNSLILPNKFVNGYRLCYINRFFLYF